MLNDVRKKPYVYKSSDKDKIPWMDTPRQRKSGPHKVFEGNSLLICDSPDAIIKKGAKHF